MTLQDYLRTALDAYEKAGYTTEADFIRSLFFDLRPLDQRIGKLSPHDLLQAARKKTGITDEKDFRDLQHTYFREFATFLLSFGRRRIRRRGRGQQPRAGSY
jgi:hypothetical protein